MPSVDIVIHAIGPVATAIRFIPANPSAQFPIPILAGTILGNLVVDPPNWQGAFAISGADAALITVDSHRNLVLLSQIDSVRDYVATASVVP